MSTIANDSYEEIDPNRAEELRLSVEAIWRQARVTCPPLCVLREYAAGDLAPEHADWLQFHIEDGSCAFCRCRLRMIGAELN